MCTSTLHTRGRCTYTVCADVYSVYSSVPSWVGRSVPGTTGTPFAGFDRPPLSVEAKQMRPGNATRGSQDTLAFPWAPLCARSPTRPGHVCSTSWRSLGCCCMNDGCLQKIAEDWEQVPGPCCSAETTPRTQEGRFGAEIPREHPSGAPSHLHILGNDKTGTDILCKHLILAFLPSRSPISFPKPSIFQPLLTVWPSKRGGRAA